MRLIELRYISRQKRTYKHILFLEKEITFLLWVCFTPVGSIELKTETKMTSPIKGNKRTDGRTTGLRMEELKEKVICSFC